jgi:hypothetical protein
MEDTEADQKGERITPREILPAGKILARFLFSSDVASSKIPVGLELVVKTIDELTALVPGGSRLVEQAGRRMNKRW